MLLRISLKPSPYGKVDEATVTSFFIFKEKCSFYMATSERACVPSSNKQTNTYEQSQHYQCRRAHLSILQMSAFAGADYELFFRFLPFLFSLHSLFVPANVLARVRAICIPLYDVCLSNLFVADNNKYKN